MLQKLTSRKFWAMVAGLVIAILTLFNTDQDTIVKSVALVTALGSIVAYIFVEGGIDTAALDYCDCEESYCVCMNEDYKE